MKLQYEKAVLTITAFAEEDVITTSAVDRHNAYRSMSELDSQPEGGVPLVPDR